jgi:hypothetical protein
VGNPSRDHLKQMMRTLLAEQFALVLHQKRDPYPCSNYGKAVPTKAGDPT